MAGQKFRSTVAGRTTPKSTASPMVSRPMKAARPPHATPARTRGWRIGAAHGNRAASVRSATALPPWWRRRRALLTCEEPHGEEDAADEPEEVRRPVYVGREGEATVRGGGRRGGRGVARQSGDKARRSHCDASTPSHHPPLPPQQPPQPHAQDDPDVHDREDELDGWVAHAALLARLARVLRRETRRAGCD